MAKLGGFHSKELNELYKKLQKLRDTADMDEFCKSCANELANRLLARATKRTPSRTGTLRRGWRISPIQKDGDKYIVEVINPVKYASYVEYGHRTPNHKGWVTGKFMLTLSAEEVEKLAPQLLENKLNKLIKGCLA